MPKRILAAFIVALTLGAGAVPQPVGAQAPSACSVTTLTDPPRQVLRCRDGLVIEAERDASFRLIGEPARPTGAELSGRALLIETGRPRPGGFQITTPHAIASVRGTIYAVDVSASQTSVFVATGTVAVDARVTGQRVVLKEGEGVDVVPGAPLQPTRWGRERAAGLLARFGR